MDSVAQGKRTRWDPSGEKASAKIEKVDRKLTYKKLNKDWFYLEKQLDERWLPHELVVDGSKGEIRSIRFGSSWIVPVHCSGRA